MHSNPKMSRRNVLKSVVLLAGATCTGALVSRHEALAQQKASKAAMKYQEKPNGAQMCGNCKHFLPPESCSVVEGKISPNGYCISWIAKA